MSLFVAIPFAYFFTESEGFAGSRKVTLVIHLVVYTLLDYMYLLIIVNATSSSLSISWSEINILADL